MVGTYQTCLKGGNPEGSKTWSKSGDTHTHRRGAREVWPAGGQTRIIPGYAGTQRLPRLVGKGRALQLILTGDLIGAHEALRIGLVNEVVPAEGLLSRCACILKEIGANSPLAVRYSIEVVNEGLETDLNSGLKLEAKYFALAAGTEDRKEGTSAFVQKRAPAIPG